MTLQGRKNALRGHQSRGRPSLLRLSVSKRLIGGGGRPVGGVGLQSVVDCLLGGWCDIKLAARPAASYPTRRAGRTVSCAAATH